MSGIAGENLCINMPVPISRRPQEVIASKMVSNLDIFGNAGAISIPLYVYDEHGAKSSNITDWGLNLFREKYGDQLSPLDIMQYCYAVLSSPAYQSKYTDNLKTDYPRIPMYDSHSAGFSSISSLSENQQDKDQINTDSMVADSMVADCMVADRMVFEFYRSRGERLIALHADYMNIVPLADLKITRDDDYLPTGIDNPNKNHVTHPMKIDKKSGVLILDNHNKIENIPLEVFNYKIGSRSALDWIVEYHKFKKLNPEKELHHATLINEGLDTYDWQTIRAGLFDLIPRIVRVSLETLEICRELDSKIASK